MSTTQRMLPRLVAVDALPNSSVVWGDAEDAALNGGTAYSATIDNNSGGSFVATCFDAENAHTCRIRPGMFFRHHSASSSVVSSLDASMFAESSSTSGVGSCISIAESRSA